MTISKVWLSLRKNNILKNQCFFECSLRNALETSKTPLEASPRPPRDVPEASRNRPQQKDRWSFFITFRVWKCAFR